jgi:transcriptional regulator with XRE-family HTH domain
VAEFARHLGISARRLTNIERGVRAPSLNLLLQISEKFQKPIAYFLAGAYVDKPYCRLTRAGQIRSDARLPGRAAPGCFAQGLLTPLARGFDGRGMDPFLVRLRSRKERPIRLRRHRGQEFIYVLNGSIKLVIRDSRVGAREEILSPGDSCFLDASLPHKFVEWAINPYGPTQADLIAVFWPGWRRP